MRKITYAGYRFPPEVIHQAIWLYLRFTLSFRDVEDLLAERGIAVSYETVRRWVNQFGPMIAAHLRKRRAIAACHSCMVVSRELMVQRPHPPKTQVASHPASWGLESNFARRQRPEKAKDLVVREFPIEDLLVRFIGRCCMDAIEVE